MQQSVIQSGPLHLNTIGQYEATLELAGGNTPVQIYSLLVVFLFAPDGELVMFKLDIQVTHGETGNGQCNTQRIIADLLYIVRRVSISGFLNAIKLALQLVKTQKKRMVE
jgi:hypothetical protein